MPDLRILDHPAELRQVEELQRLVWPDDDTEVIPIHLLQAAVDHGGVLIGAFDADALVGFVFGFPGLDAQAAPPQPIHVSHMAGIHPAYRDRGLGFALKRAQWQFVRQQGLAHICWTYDPLYSRNARLNIAKLGAVCNTYLPEYYGELRDGLNVGWPSDRFRVDWWVNTPRVVQRLDRASRPRLGLAHFLQANAEIVNPVQNWLGNLPEPSADIKLFSEPSQPLLLVEIPAEVQVLRQQASQLALAWRLHTRKIFQTYFALDYLVTDFIHEPGAPARSFYVLSHGESTF